VVASALSAIRSLPGHPFWPDSYLLPLARANQGKLATMDQKLATEVVAECRASLALL